MTDDRQPAGLDSYDDEAIGRLVRDTAAGWSMPAVRLDAPSWRDRIGSPRARRLAGARGWFGRVGQAATAAIALTVVGALVAVMLTRAPITPGVSPAPTTSAGPGETGAPGASPLPKLVLNGDLPSVTDVLVLTEFGTFKRVDLTTGDFDQEVTGGGPGGSMSPQADGSIACLCVASPVTSGGVAVVLTVRLDRFDHHGAFVSTSPIETFTGAPDPRDAGVTIPDQPANVLTATSFSDDGRFGFVGWSLRGSSAWHSGVLAVDLRDGTVVSRLALPDVTTGTDPARRVVAAPKIVGAAGAGRLVVVEPWYEFTPATAAQPAYSFGNDLFQVGFADARWSTDVPVATASDCGTDVFRAGPLAGGGTWIACSTGGMELTTIRRLAADGSRIGDVHVVGTGGIDAELVAVSTDGTVIYVWDPAGATLTRVDLATGTTTIGHGATGTAAANGGPLAALGSWLAPSAAAKTLLRGGLVISPDGSRVYAIGVGTPSASSGVAGSSGVFAFDATTLAQVAHYAPTADFASVAVSADGRFVYAAGLPGVDATGAQASQSASITVFSTVDGSVRVIAGELGFGMLSFLEPVLD
jgi:hypothetical protein